MEAPLAVIASKGRFHICYRQDSHLRWANAKSFQTSSALSVRWMSRSLGHK